MSELTPAKTALQRKYRRMNWMICAVASVVNFGLWLFTANLFNLFVSGFCAFVALSLFRRGRSEPKAACSIQAFDGCSCTQDCQSATVPLIDLDRKFKERAEARQQQSSIIVSAQYGMATILALSLVWIALVHSGAPESRRLVKATQEQEIGHVVR